VLVIKKRVRGQSVDVVLLAQLQAFRESNSCFIKIMAEMREQFSHVEHLGQGRGFAKVTENVEKYYLLTQINRKRNKKNIYQLFNTIKYF
jgi:hypothetical protein